MASCSGTPVYATTCSQCNSSCNCPGCSNEGGTGSCINTPGTSGIPSSCASCGSSYSCSTTFCPGCTAGTGSCSGQSSYGCSYTLCNESGSPYCGNSTYGYCDGCTYNASPVTTSCTNSSSYPSCSSLYSSSSTCTAAPGCTYNVATATCTAARPTCASLADADRPHAGRRLTPRALTLAGLLLGLADPLRRQHDAVGLQLGEYGCSWSTCGGTIQPCSAQTTQTACAAVNECEWSTGTATCSGVIKPCSMLDESHCSLAARLPLELS